jgi:hypothetical protein
MQFGDILMRRVMDESKRPQRTGDQRQMRNPRDILPDTPRPDTKSASGKSGRQDDGVNDWTRNNKCDCKSKTEERSFGQKQGLRMTDARF